MGGMIRKLGRAPGFTLIELMIVVAIIGILAAIAIPSFVKYIRRTRTTEALMNLRAMFTGAVAYYDGEHFDRTGVQYPAQFPGTVPITPAVVPPGKAVLTPPSDWAHPTWQALNFSLSDPHYYSYAFTSTGTGKDSSCTMDAYGDLNGDGVYGLMSRIATVDTAGNVVGAYGIYFNEEIN